VRTRLYRQPVYGLFKPYTLLFVLAAVTPLQAQDDPVILPASSARLVNLEAALLEAHYSGDLDQLASLAEEAGKLGERDSGGWLSAYYSGWAHYMLALMKGPNGLASPEGEPAAVARHIRYAIGALEISIEGNPDFADALALLSHLYSMAVRVEPQRGAELGPMGRSLLNRALQLEPDNPRVALIEAMRLFWLPPAVGGDRERGLQRWERAIQLFERADATDSSPLPSWGHAEAWAWLSGAYLALTDPDSEAASQAVREALLIRPDFLWVQVSAAPSARAALEEHQ
jgi:tetratricopeptide (TPR) repeat protein